MSEIQAEFIPVLTWLRFLYKQQGEYCLSKSWQTWLIAGNGTGKTLIIYENLLLHLYGIHPLQLAVPPLKAKVLVPSFDYVEDVALEKMMSTQRIVYQKFNKTQKDWIGMLSENDIISNHRLPDGDEAGSFEMPPLLPGTMIVKKKGYSKEHKGIELKNGSSLWFVTSEQGWQAQRGGECDILLSDEEGDERVWDELKRGLRNAKNGGKIYAGLTPPYEEGQGPTWTKEKVLEASVDDPEITVINACMADNPAVTPKFIKEFSKGKSSKQIAVQIYGKYPSWGDLVHPDFQDRLWDSQKIDGHLLSNDTPMPDNNEVDWVMAFDWHQSKPCAAVWGFIDRNGDVTIFDELDKDFAENKEISELSEAFFAIEGHPHEQRKFRRWQDPSAKAPYKAVQRGFNAWDAFRKHGIITSAGKNRDPEVGISIFNDFLRGNGKDHPRLFIYERCKYLRQYLGNHYWKRGADGKGKPDPKWSDYPICVRYIVQEIRGTRAKRSRWPLQSFAKPKSDKKIYNIGSWV